VNQSKLSYENIEDDQELLAKERTSISPPSSTGQDSSMNGGIFEAEKREDHPTVDNISMKELWVII